MKSAGIGRLIFPCCALAMLTGCVGSNYVLFMTKSNAGLDIDGTPPTAQINISRKEAVVAPAFEGGQTPPLMASFGAKTGALGSLGRFFFGVDQTFAGGNAAVTMAKLYASTDSSPIAQSPAIRLTQKPNDAKLLEPGQVKPFVFGTDTQLGVTLGWTGMGQAYPGTIKIGFSRKETAIAPVTLTENKQEAKSFDVRIPSFLATVESNVRGENKDADLSWMQYFATGTAADNLALQPAVREAMLKRADPVANSLSKKIQENLDQARNEAQELAQQVAVEIDRLNDDAQLNQAADALQQSGLVEANQVAELRSLPDPVEKRRLLKAAATGLESPGQARQLADYLNRLKAVR